MKYSDSRPHPAPIAKAVLLIFMPPERTARSQRASVRSLANSLQQHLGNQARVLKIDEATQPDVFRSFEITQTPSFVLVRQGVELWRQVGMTDEELLTLLSKRLQTS
ncbi:thioredoxin [Larkinella rosea]|uniref:Thioredoxin n=2 Tax=Larkinella rosea TaxID=2025312 RepID=A0A3P1C4N7_9BACT|nr:thioredoxin [Larkinella rosea]